MMAIDPAIVPMMEELVRTVGEGWLVPASPPDIPEAGKFGPQPWRTFIEPLRTQNSAALTLPRTYIWCTAKPTSGEAALPATYRSTALARAEGWEYQEIATGHTPMYEKPDGLADLLIEVAGACPPNPTHGSPRGSRGSTLLGGASRKTLRGTGTRHML